MTHYLPALCSLRQVPRWVTPSESEVSLLFSAVFVDFTEMHLPSCPLPPEGPRTVLFDTSSLVWCDTFVTSLAMLLSVHRQKFRLHFGFILFQGRKSLQTVCEDNVTGYLASPGFASAAWTARVLSRVLLMAYLGSNPTSAAYVAK